MSIQNYLVNWKSAVDRKPNGNHEQDELQCHKIQDTRGRQG